VRDNDQREGRVGCFDVLNCVFACLFRLHFSLARLKASFFEAHAVAAPTPSVQIDLVHERNRSQ